MHSHVVTSNNFLCPFTITIPPQPVFQSPATVLLSTAIVFTVLE
jgi:hypothetical protein